MTTKMHTNIQVKVYRLNQLYHRIISNRFVDEDIDVEQFKNLIRELKRWGYRFRISEADLDCYFKTDTVGKWIDFMQGDYPIDAYILL